MKDFLFVWWEGGGNVPPAVGLVRRLVAAGHRVRVLSDPCNDDDFTKAGAEFRAYQRPPYRRTRLPADDYVRDWEARNQFELIRLARDRAIVGPALSCALDALDEIERRRPDALIVMDFMFGALFAAEKARLPVAMVAPHILIRPAPGMPPFGPGVMPARGPFGWMRDRLIGMLATGALNRALPGLNAHRATLGLPPARSIWEMLDKADRHLILTSPAFDFPADRLPENVRYVGPVLDDPVWAVPWQNPWPEPQTEPLVLVGLSSTFQNQGGLVQRILEALGPLPVRALATLGPTLASTGLSAASNTRIVPSAPHSQILPLTAAMITHAGHGSVIRGLANGVPLICIPMGRDQNDVAARVVYRGAGLRLGVGASPTQIRTAVTRVLYEPTFRESANRLASVIRRDAAASKAVDELVAIASG